MEKRRVRMGLAKSNNNVLGIDKDFFTREITDNVATKGFIQTSAQDVINLSLIHI